MTGDTDSYFALVERIRRRAPAYLDLLTAETDDQFEAAFEVVLEVAVRHLEKNKANFQSLNEVGLSGALAGALAIPGLTVTQEAHSNGHVDLTIEADHCFPARIKLGEAKIYDGCAYHISGLDQLLRRRLGCRRCRRTKDRALAIEGSAGHPKEIAGGPHSHRGGEMGNG
ncbi:MAG: hypothetical protein ACLQOO_33395, partial [Terriglobia bacterium]